MPLITPRRRNWLLILATLVAVTYLAQPAPSERLPSPYFDLPSPMVIAHQGGNLLRPGNTYLSFDHARALGADVLEMDLHLTAPCPSVVRSTVAS